MRLSPCVLVQPDGWARGEREGYGGPCDVTSLSLTRTLSQQRFIHLFKTHFSNARRAAVPTTSDTPMPTIFARSTFPSFA